MRLADQVASVLHYQGLDPCFNDSDLVVEQVDNIREVKDAYEAGEITLQAAVQRCRWILLCHGDSEITQDECNYLLTVFELFSAEDNDSDRPRMTEIDGLLFEVDR
jgi:uncharacterized protein YbgA (DUF1722 family)